MLNLCISLMIYYIHENCNFSLLFSFYLIDVNFMHAISCTRLAEHSQELLKRILLTKLFHWVLLINVNLKNKSFWRKCVQGARKGKKCTFSHTVHIFVFFFLFTLIKSNQWNNLRCFPKACTHIFNNIYFRLQGLQIGAFQQHYLKCKCETPYFEGELVPKTCNNWKMSSKKNFWVVWSLK